MEGADPTRSSLLLQSRKFFQSRRTAVAIAYNVSSFDWSAGAEATTNAAAEPPSKPPKTVCWVALLLILVGLNQVPIE